jgi:predicted nucleic acid-binding protein
VDRKFVDVNAIAVFLDESHVGHRYLRAALRPGMEGAFKLVLASYLLLRARWILVSQWGVPGSHADRAVGGLARLRFPEYVDGDGGVVVRAIELSGEFSHDVYDCFLLALAEKGEATHFVTTDVGVRRVCEKIGIRYENPVPRGILAQFGKSGRRSA